MEMLSFNKKTPVKPERVQSCFLSIGCPLQLVAFRRSHSTYSIHIHMSILLQSSRKVEEFPAAVGQKVLKR